MNLYKIARIQHAGSLLDREDDRYPDRVGRIVSMSPDNLSIGRPMYLNYVKDSDGTPYFGVLRTSHVNEIYLDSGADFSQFRVLTDNTLYSFEKVED